MQSQLAGKYFPIILISLFALFRIVLADFSLVCNPGYRLSAIKRVNSAHQRGKVGSLSIECQPLLAVGTTNKVKCETLESAPQCNGLVEGCAGRQWIAGFNVYTIHNDTNATLLDPICCESPELNVDQLSCASERLNLPKMAFDHSIQNSDFIYRGLQCWHQYDIAGTAVDLVWKAEICQIRNGKQNNNTGLMSNPQDNCPPCGCHCGINLCGNGNEPIRVIHKNFVRNKCACECICRFECI